MRTFFQCCGILLFASSALSGCATGLSIEELDRKVRGMSRQQLLACMGPPSASAKDGNMEFLTYGYRNVWDAYLNRCDTNFILTEGRVSRVSVTRYAQGTVDATTSYCRSLVAKCLP